MFDIKNKSVTVIGAGRSGLALVRLIQRAGGEPRLTDGRDSSAMTEADLQTLHERNVVTEFGGHTRSFLEGSDFVVLSPGVPYHAPIVGWATEQSIPVMGEIEFAYQFTQAPVIGVTGSNGKTTVVNLIYRVLQEAGVAACLCGNVGYPFSNYCLDGIDYGYYVLELSSFQLEALLSPDHPVVRSGVVKGFRPKIGVVLNFSENHLDRHRDLEDYFSAKWKIYQNIGETDYAVINMCCPHMDRAAGSLAGKVRPFLKPGESADGMNPNYLAVTQVARLLNIPSQTVSEVLANFKGVEHRMEFVRTLQDVIYINDSKSTTVEAGRWALRQLTGPVLMICGGRDKNIDFVPLRALVKERVKTLYVIGEASGKIRHAFQEVVPVVECADMAVAVNAARSGAVSGDSVLLSPMCASFDMFKNFEERGEVYKQIVRGL
ncbi:MAG: UDP-N-acetylmuramoyl-L-alanine--D-glutamate ligase [Candidatus Omnitrophica bacterium]|nr:UDP-N-acetylmuramoyl-L-alanine--D-glutamate ligase [Candidatus Omnitrophota bacterium]